MRGLNEIWSGPCHAIWALWKVGFPVRAAQTIAQERSERSRLGGTAHGHARVYRHQWWR